MLKVLIKKIKSKKSKGYQKGGEKTYTKHELNVLIKKKLKKAFKGKKKCKQEPHNIKKLMFQYPRYPDSPVTISSKNDNG